MPGKAKPIAGQLRAGSISLGMLADSVNVSILRLLARRARESTELSARLEAVSRSKRFEHLSELEELGIVGVKKRGSPPLTHYRLTATGRRLAPVSRLLTDWLSRAPRGKLALGDPLACEAITALTSAWGATVLRWLVERPRSVTELEGQSPTAVSSHDLRRVCDALLKAELIERVPGKGRHRRYTVTHWAREAIAPLVAGVHWERRYIPNRSPEVAALDVEAGLLLGLSLVELPADLDGPYVLLVDSLDHGEPIAGVAVTVKRGRVCECSPQLEHAGAGWVRGTAPAWLDAVTEARPNELSARGGAHLASAFVLAVHSALSDPVLQRTETRERSPGLSR